MDEKVRDEFLQKNRVRVDKFMTEDEIEEAYHNIGMVNRRAVEMQQLMAELKEYDIAYNGDQPKLPKRPNTRINIVQPNIEGQVAAICLQDIGVTYQGQEYSDQQFADWARMNTEWTLAHQADISDTIATFARRLLKYGWGIYKLSFDKNKFKGFGLALIETPSLDRVFIDSKVKNAKELQNAEYIAEAISASRRLAVALYGKDKADSISYGVTSIVDGIQGIFDNREFIVDDVTAWCPLQFWTIDEGYLRIREYDSSALLLWDSFKGLDRKENQKNNPVVPRELYTQVDNAYPYIIKNCYEKEGELFGFGDIKLIIELQNMLHTVYDNIRQSIKPNKNLIAESSGIMPEDLDEDSFESLLYSDTSMINGNTKPVNEVSMGTPNPEWWRMIASIYEAIQRVLRYSELMMGQGSSSNTATESAIQERQGSRATSMKQKQVENALKEALTYCLGLDLQYKTGKRALRLDTEKNDMEWVDYDLMKNMPSTVPMEAGERKKWTDAGYNAEQIPNTQIAMKGGKPITRMISLDLKINIGAKVNQSPQARMQLINQLAAMQALSEDGKVRPILFWEEIRKYMVDENGLPLDSVDGIKESLAEYEKMEAQKQQLEIEAQQAQIQAAQSKASDSSLPGGTPKAIVSPDQRAEMNVMQGQADFAKMQ